MSPRRDNLATRRHVLRIAAPAAIFGGAAYAVAQVEDDAATPATQPTTQPTSQSAEVAVNTAAVIETVNRVAMLTDMSDYDGLAEIFASEVDVTPPNEPRGRRVRESADVFLRGWAQSLVNFDATHHLIGSHIVLPEPDGTARCHANVIATCVRNAPGGMDLDRDFEWTLGGRYDFTLEPSETSPTGYAVSAWTFAVLWEEGDPRIAERNFGE